MVLARQRHEPCVRYSGRHFTAGRNRNTAFVPNVHDEGGRLDLREEMSNVKFGDGLKISHRGFRRGADTLKLIEHVDLLFRLPLNPFQLLQAADHRRHRRVRKVVLPFDDADFADIDVAL